MSFGQEEKGSSRRPWSHTRGDKPDLWPACPTHNGREPALHTQGDNNSPPDSCKPSAADWIRRLKAFGPLPRTGELFQFIIFYSWGRMKSIAKLSRLQGTG